MIRYNLDNTAQNQSFNTTINGHDFEFVFHTFRNLIYVDCYIDEEIVSAGQIAVPNTSIFGGSVNSVAAGEFIFVCTTEDYPYYESFDSVNCYFAYRPF